MEESKLHRHADGSRAGEGDIVWWVGGREAALALPETFVPVDAAVVGIVDAVYPEEDVP